MTSTQAHRAGGKGNAFAPRRALPRPWGIHVITASAIVAAAAATVPLAYLLIRVAGADRGALGDALGRGRMLRLALNTLGLTAAVSATTLVLGVVIAWLLTRTDLPARGFWLVVSSLPLAIPSYVAAFGWVATTPLRGFAGSWLVLTLCNVPLVTLPTIAALRQANTNGEDVARTLGRSARRAFLESTWPQVRPAALAGTLLVALYVLSDFGAVALMRFQAFTWSIQIAYGALFDRTLAAAMALVLALMGVAVVAAERKLRGSAPARGSSVTAKVPPARLALGRWTWPISAGLVTLASLGLGVPLGALARFLTMRTSTSTTTNAGDVMGDALSTVGLALAGAAVALFLALPIGIMAARRRSRLAGLVESASYLGLALPGIVVGLSLVFFSLQVVPALYQTVWMLAFAYGVLFLPKAVGAVRASTAAVEPGLEEVARTLGSRPSAVWARVTARIAWPGIATGVILVALAAMKELPATLLLRPSGVDTLATSLWRYTDVSAYAAAAPYALILVLVAVGPVLLLVRDSTKGRADQKGAP